MEAGPGRIPRCPLCAKSRHASYFGSTLTCCSTTTGRLAGLRLDPNPSAVHLNDALGYGKAQASATLLAGDGIIGLLKLLTQLGLISSGNARTRA